MTFFEAYDEIVDAITSQGLEVYGLLNDELAPGLGNGEAFEAAYAANALAVIDRYKDRVRVWETLNEPNDYAGGTSARFTPAAFASAHARVYDAVKRAHVGDACWDVKIVTGPLFSFDGVSASDYLDATIAAGRAGGRWKTLRDALGRDPIDDVGYHVYVAQGPDSPASEVGASAGANLAAIRSVIDKYALGDKKVWISEIGYRLPLFDEVGQAARVDTLFAALGARSDVASIQWFTIGDFGGEGWGLFGGSFAAKDRRPSYDRFVAQAKVHAPALAAKLEVSLPPKIAAGATAIAKVKATNLGTSTWRASDEVRIGAASGCPSAWAVNAISWKPVGADGYASSATDARRFLGSVAIAQGSSVTVDVPVVAPSTVGMQRFAARMVKEGLAWVREHRGRRRRDRSGVELARRRPRRWQRERWRGAYHAGRGDRAGWKCRRVVGVRLPHGWRRERRCEERGSRARLRARPRAARISRTRPRSTMITGSCSSRAIPHPRSMR